MVSFSNQRPCLERLRVPPPLWPVASIVIRVRGVLFKLYLLLFRSPIIDRVWKGSGLKRPRLRVAPTFGEWNEGAKYTSTRETRGTPARRGERRKLGFPRVACARVFCSLLCLSSKLGTTSSLKCPDEFCSQKIFTRVKTCGIFLFDRVFFERQRLTLYVGFVVRSQWSQLVSTRRCLCLRATSAQWFDA